MTLSVSKLGKNDGRKHTQHSSLKNIGRCKCQNIASSSQRWALLSLCLYLLFPSIISPLSLSVPLLLVELDSVLLYTPVYLASLSLYNESIKPHSPFNQSIKPSCASISRTAFLLFPHRFCFSFSLDNLSIWPHCASKPVHLASCSPITSQNSQCT